jgi:hypothetical protein
MIRRHIVVRRADDHRGNLSGRANLLCSEPNRTARFLALAMLRADSSGVIYQRTSTGEQVYLDPKSASPAATYTGAVGCL